MVRFPKTIIKIHKLFEINFLNLLQIYLLLSVEKNGNLSENLHWPLGGKDNSLLIKPPYYRNNVNLYLLRENSWRGCIYLNAKYI